MSHDDLLYRLLADARPAALPRALAEQLLNRPGEPDRVGRGPVLVGHMSRPANHGRGATAAPRDGSGAAVRRRRRQLAKLTATSRRVETPARGSSPGFVARMNSVSCCCLLLAGKFASRWKTRVAVPSSPVSSSVRDAELVVRHCGHVDARAFDVDAAGAPDAYLQREAVCVCSLIGPDSTSNATIWVRAGGARSAIGAVFALLLVGQPFGPGRCRHASVRCGHSRRGHDRQRERGDGGDHQTSCDTRRAATVGCQGNRSMVSSSVDWARALRRWAKVYPSQET